MLIFKLTAIDAAITQCSSQFNTLRPRQNERHFADEIFKCNFVNENVWIPIKMSLKFVPISPINNIPALVQIMAWRRPGDKPLSEPMMVGLPTHICVTRPQWVNGDYISMTLVYASLLTVTIPSMHNTVYSKYFPVLILYNSLQRYPIAYPRWRDMGVFMAPKFDQYSFVVVVVALCPIWWNFWPRYKDVVCWETRLWAVCTKCVYRIRILNIHPSYFWDF